MDSGERGVTRGHDVVGIFPDLDVLIRLVSAVPAEQDYDWTAKAPATLASMTSSAGRYRDQAGEKVTGKPYIPALGA